jgi:hypothetical protein
MGITPRVEEEDEEEDDDTDLVVNNFGSASE